MTKNTPISTLPRATLRLQMNKQFTFAHARAQIPYFAQLGISHLYLSPILTARAGSPHGYDVIDYGNVNPELGGERELQALVAELRRLHMGLIVDIVPNHMAVGGGDNLFWLDVLEWGMHSRYANFFDIDWDVPDPALKNRLLAPFLGKPYGETLQSGEITLHFDASLGRFAFHYFEHVFPLAPHTYASLLRHGGNSFAEYAQRFGNLRRVPPGNRANYFTECCTALSDAARQYESETAQALRALVTRLNTNDEYSHHTLHDLLQYQHYRLASWRTAADEINWRRFFDVIQLAGICVQTPAVFEVVHATTLRLYAMGLIDGVRVDHIDGLAYPRDYCHRLRSRLKKLQSSRPADAAQGPAYFVVEKILAPGERFPRDWRVDGTTGYSFMNEVGALLHDPNGENELANCWSDISGRDDDFSGEIKSARRRVLRDLLPAEFNACAYALHKIARHHIATRDWSLFSIRRVLAELLIQFPIYRTYADANGRNVADNNTMSGTIANALPACRPSDAALLVHIDNWLGREPPRYLRGRQQRQSRLHAIARFQQLSAPLAAKATEDTAFYRYNKLLSRNEVGAIPSQFALSPEDFHAELSYRAAHFPRAMLTTATHDHKRGEDLRARLAVLSEVPSLWCDNVRHWRELNAQYKVVPLSAIHEWPQRVDEYMLYQMLVGSWPPQLQPYDQNAMREWCNRLARWLTKALREAKNITSWTEPNPAYESACKYFLSQLLDPRISADFINSLYKFVETIAPAGVLNSLTQVILRFTAPGVPDTYQGCDNWDFSLADPDNRREVDYIAHREMFENRGENRHALIEHWRSGQVKQQLIYELLQLRNRLRDLFAYGDYRPLSLRGTLAQNGFAFARSWQRQILLVFVPRLTAPLLVTQKAPVITPASWLDTHIELPAALSSRRWHSLFDKSGALPKSIDDFFNNADAAITTRGRKLLLRDFLSSWPFAVLWTDADSY